MALRVRAELVDPVTRLTRTEILARANAVAHELLGCSSEEAFVRLDRGELAGTMAEPELRMLRDMLAGLT